MATIGLDNLFYAKITEDLNGNETYATPIPLAKAMTANLQINTIEGKLYADDVLDTLLREFSDGTISFGIKDIGPTIAADLTGAVIDSNPSRRESWTDEMKQKARERAKEVKRYG